MLLVTKAERDAIKAKLPKTGFACTKRKVYMEESLQSVFELQKLRQVRDNAKGERNKQRRH